MMAVLFIIAVKKFKIRLEWQLIIFWAAIWLRRMSIYFYSLADIWLRRKAICYFLGQLFPSSTPAFFIADLVSTGSTTTTSSVTNKKEQELGDVFFSLVNYARISGINPDSALEKTNNKFINRFQKMENLALDKNLNLADLSLEKMDELWEEAKKNE